MATVGQRLENPPEPNPEDPPPLLQPDVQNVAGVDFESDRANIILEPGLVLIPNPDADDPDGSIDMVVTFSFVPTAGDTWIVQALLLVQSQSELDHDVVADFDSTAELVRVVVPEGVSFSSAAGASYDVVVPEPGAAVLIALGALATAFARRALH